LNKDEKKVFQTKVLELVLNHTDYEVSANKCLE
jgi:hypothetical protein